MKDLYISTEEMEKLRGTTGAESIIGRIAYNANTKEYMILADALGYESGYTYVAVVFTHGVKRAVFDKFKKGAVAARHDGVTGWFEPREAAKYQKYKELLQEFIDNCDTRPMKTKEEKAAPKENKVDMKEIEMLRSRIAELEAKCGSLEADLQDSNRNLLKEQEYRKMLEQAISKDGRKVYKVEPYGKLRDVFLYRTDWELNRKKKSYVTSLI